MKKTHYFPIILALALILAIPSLSSAEEGVSVNADISASASVSPIPSTSGRPAPTNIRDKIRAEMEQKNKNIQVNQTLRNNVLEQRKGMNASTSPIRKEIRDDRRENVGDIRMEGRNDMKNASSSPERKDIRRDMRLDIFKARKDAFIAQLTLSLNNLKQIRARISTRIDKAVTEGKNVTEAKKLLVTADSKITLAEQAIASLRAFSPTTTPSTVTSDTSATTSASVDLGKPRQIGENAIKSINTAREALGAVIRSLMKILNIKPTPSVSVEASVSSSPSVTP